MRKIAARAGITAGAIYKHFSGKEEMLKALKEAQGTEEITSAAVKLISAWHKSDVRGL